MNKLSVICPTYRNPRYLDLFLKSAVDGRRMDTTQIIVSVDGFYNESAEVLKKYDGKIDILDLGTNKGMATAINMAVWNAGSENLFILNDDQVMPDGWDVDLYDLDLTNTVYTVEQIERTHGIFGFTVENFGDTTETFDLVKYNSFVKQYKSLRETDSARIFPYLISKKWFMTVGGYDIAYASPFWVDADWLKLELLGLKFKRTYRSLIFHWGSTATKNRQDGEAKKFHESEISAGKLFYYKWGYLPLPGRTTTNTKFPSKEDGNRINGIIFP
jgi:GT2 family glycosyltransferase